MLSFLLRNYVFCAFCECKDTADPTLLLLSSPYYFLFLSLILEISNFDPVKMGVSKMGCVPIFHYFSKVGINWYTNGDKISFDVSKISDRRTRVRVSSRPAWRTTIFDFGKNFKNVEKIIGFLKEHTQVD